MANYTAADIKALREKTGAGMMDVKKALDESDGDQAKAMEALRIKGLKGATKREGRSTSDGLVATSVEGGVGTMIELNSETDFVDRKEIKDRVKYYYGREACLDAVKHPIYKFYVYHSEGGHSLGEIREALDCVPTHSLTQSSANNIEIMPSNISKGTGLRDLAERLEIEPENILALGDQLNDVPMLEFAGISVAMGNAAQAVKDTAVHLTASNMDDGVAEAIHRFCL